MCCMCDDDHHDLYSARRPPAPSPERAQCRLRRGDTVQTSWLPRRFAKVGRLLALKEAGAWQDGWRVEEVY